MTEETLYSALHWAKKAEYWAGQSAQGQIQSDWAQSDNTKKDFIKNKPGINDLLPSQTGNSGKFLTTNGTASSWATVDALPAQSGQSGKYLTTDGTSASWGSIPSDSTKANTSLNNLDSTGQSVINGKVDLNFNNMNPSASAKETIVGWGMPDFSAGVSRSLNTVYQAEKDGWIIVHGTQSSNSNSNAYLQYSVDGTFSDGIIVIINYTGNSTQTEGSFIAPVPKGIYYRSTELGTLVSFIYYPCKGA